MSDLTDETAFMLAEQIEKLRKESIDPMGRTILRLSDNIAYLAEQLHRLNQKFGGQP